MTHSNVRVKEEWKKGIKLRFIAMNLGNLIDLSNTEFGTRSKLLMQSVNIKVGFV